MSLLIRDKMRSRSVLRWHTVGIAGSQSVSEHSHCMSIIAEELLTLVVQEKVTLEDRYYILKHSQVHDLSEVLVGDLSSPFKKYLCEKSLDFAKILDDLEFKLIPELVEIYKHFDKNKYLYILSKLADYLEAFSYIKTYKGGDEQHNNVVIKKLNTLIDETIEKGKFDFPDLNWYAVHQTKHNLVDGDSVILNFETILKV